LLRASAAANRPNDARDQTASNGGPPYSAHTASIHTTERYMHRRRGCGGHRRCGPQDQRAHVHLAADGDLHVYARAFVCVCVCLVRTRCTSASSGGSRCLASSARRGTMTLYAPRVCVCRRYVVDDERRSRRGPGRRVRECAFNSVARSVSLAQLSVCVNVLLLAACECECICARARLTFAWVGAASLPVRTHGALTRSR
jgi:hypothetical protein